MDKCYFAHGGNELVIGGKLTVLKGATVEGLSASNAASAANQPDSTATTVAALREDLNRLLGALKAAGLMAPDAETEPTDEPGDAE